jgi:hypothetical protein
MSKHHIVLLNGVDYIQNVVNISLSLLLPMSTYFKAHSTFNIILTIIKKNNRGVL